MASIRTTPNGMYQVRYRDPDRRARAKNFKRKIDARKFAEAIATDIDRGAFVDPQLGRTPLVEWAESWMATRHNLARSTLDRDWSYLRNMILPQFGSMPVSKVKTSDVRRWLAELDAAPNTKAKVLQLLSGILDMAVDDKAIVSNPCSKVKRPRQQAQRRGLALNDSQVDAVIEAAREADSRNAAMVYAMARLGLRVGEAMALQTHDFDAVAATLTVQRTLSRNEGVRPLKAKLEGDARVLNIPSDVTEVLAGHLADMAVTSIERFMFTTRTGRPLSYTTWRSRVWGSRDNPKAGSIRDLIDFDAKPHDLRHTVATNLFVRDGWTVPQVQAFMGHTTASVTLDIYTHVKAEALPTPAAFRVVS